MSRMGILWDENHKILIDPDPDKTGFVNSNLVYALRDHLVQEHRHELQLQVWQCQDQIRRDIVRLKQETYEIQKDIEASFERIFRWNRPALKQLRDIQKKHPLVQPSGEIKGVLFQSDINYTR